MSAFLTLDSLSAATPDGRILFSGLTFSLGRERVGLVGRNGAGKSTLLSIMMGDYPSRAGTVTRRGRFSLFRQVHADENCAVMDALGVREALTRLHRLEKGMGVAQDAALADWGLEERLAGALRLAGLPGLPMDRMASSLSGGERSRLGLAAMLATEPDVLLMDEPTNNLDRQGREALSALLSGWRGGAIIASHDRELLEGMDWIIHLSPTGCRIVGGGWSLFEAARDAERMQVEHDLDMAWRGRRQAAQAMQRQAEKQARRDKAGRAKRAKGDAPKILLDAQAGRAERTAARGKQLGARLTQEAQAAYDRARERTEIVTPLHIDLPECHLPAGQTVLRLEEVVCERGGHRLFGPLSLTMTGPRHIAISGPNGAGKTSLLHIVTGQEMPASGRVRRGQGARMAMLDQHVALLNPAQDLVSNMRRLHPAMTREEAHQVLARFAFRNEDALRPAARLSGGERLRAGLAMVMGGPETPHLLVLDEPTNHLDMDAVELLERALARWDGALLIVSHDRRFLEAIGMDREIVLPGGGGFA